MSTKFMEREGGKIAYEEIGTGPLVICVPGMGDVRGQFRFLAPQLAKAGYRVVSMDMRGHGESSTKWADASVVGVGADILALIRHLKAGPAVIAGNSLAAGAAVWAAAESPELVSGLVLLGPAVHGDPSFFMRLFYRLLFLRPWGAAVWERFYPTLYPSRKPADFAPYLAGLKRNLQEPGRLAMLYRMAVASKKASAERIEQVKQPALVIMGSKDPDFKDPRAEAEWVAQGLKARCEVVDGAGHYPHTEMPELTVPMVLAFLQSLKVPAHAA